MQSKIGILLILLLAFLQCSSEKKGSKQSSALALLSQKASGSLSSPSMTSSECPPKNLPSDIFLANKISNGKKAQKAINGICGDGTGSGSLDVYTLDSDGLILEWENKKVANEKGTDFIVFENPFEIGSKSNQLFLEPVVVEVSVDKNIWCGFNPTLETGKTYSSDSSKWKNFAGLVPVIYNMSKVKKTATELFKKTGISSGGGDHFDLDNLVLSSSCNQNNIDKIKNNGFIYIKLISATDKGFPKSSSSFDGKSDIDGVIAKKIIDRK